MKNCLSLLCVYFVSFMFAMTACTDPELPEPVSYNPNFR